MSTRSHICYENEDGSVKGVYCHYDGYPSNILPYLREMTWEDVKSMVDDACRRGGMRCIGECFDNGEDNDWSVNEWPPSPTEDYAYLVKRDGTIAYVGWGENERVDDGTD